MQTTGDDAKTQTGENLQIYGVVGQVAPGLAGFTENAGGRQDRHWCTKLGHILGYKR